MIITDNHFLDLLSHVITLKE